MTRYIYPILFSLVILTWAAGSAYMYGKDVQRQQYGETYTFVKENADYITQIQLIELEEQGV